MVDTVYVRREMETQLEGYLRLMVMGEGLERGDMIVMTPSTQHLTSGRTLVAMRMGDGEGGVIHREKIMGTRGEGGWGELSLRR